ncbi:anti-sigma-I factor RsgI family protein [Halalkalibacter alkalisediminis]|uniref:RsgI N-terminal anti-sigma domain-containing protein n=1 Tax=Halalkalibacter alkalisediminis TaxID=935616 RepID=A0ABV6NC35_9BACI|nr:hypothetical protein [Halalkalibacter alkalisediminis]
MKKEIINGTVVKVTETQIVLITEEGSFKNVPKLKTEVPLIGQAYSYTENKMINKRWLPYSAMAVALLFLIFTSLTFPFGGSAEEAFIITIDINPSIEVATDDQYQVIRVEGLNEDGQNILADLQLENDLSDVLRQILEKTINSGYVQVEEPLIATSVVPLEKESEEMISLLEEVIYVSLEEHHVVSEVIISNEKIEMYEEAKEHNLSLNYYKEYKVLEASGVVKDQAEIKGKTLAELKRMENKERKEEKQKSETKNSRNKEQSPAAEQSKSNDQKKNKETKPETKPVSEKNGKLAEKQKDQKGIEKKPSKAEKAKDDKKNQQESKAQGQGSEKKANPNPKNSQANERNVRN